MGGTILNSLQEVRKNYQSGSEMYHMAEIMSDCETKLNGPWIKQEGSVKWSESVHNMYYFKFGFRFELKSTQAPHTGIFLSSK